MSGSKTLLRMKRSHLRRLVARLVLVLVSVSAFATGTGGVTRLGLFVGANDGGAERVRLRWAEQDARTLAEVMQRYGGLTRENTWFLVDPDRQELQEGLDRLAREVSRRRDSGGRIEVMLYYSGHSDDRGLLVGEDHFGYADLRSALEATEADVTLAILDSCASGAFTRSKGGERVSPFLLDESNSTIGYAFLASASEDEDAQESDSLGASFFTHYLVNGLRGAADVNSDSRVTLNELYGFAFQQTLARTESTQAGPQHPAYEFALSGTGDLVITQLAAANSRLSIQAPTSGRIFIRDGQDRLVAELGYTLGTGLVLALPAGQYRVTLQAADATWTADVRLGAFSPEALVAADFEQRRREWFRVRGESDASDPEPPRRPGAPPVAAALDTEEEDLRERQIAIPVLPMFSPGLSLFPGLENTFRSPVVLSATIGQVHDSEGIMASGVMSISVNTVFGLQAGGLGAIAGGTVYGMQAGGAFAFAQADFVGIQAAGALAIAEQDIAFGQYAGAVAIAHGTVSGVQASGAFAYAGAVRGAQISVVNVAGRIEGVQIGVVNISNSMRGVPIGLVNIIRDGIHDVVVTAAPDGSRVDLSWLNGSQTFYSLLNASYLGDGRLDSVRGFTAGLGLGTRLRSGALFTDLELLASAAASGNNPATTLTNLVSGGEDAFLGGQARARLGLDFGEDFGFFASAELFALVLDEITAIPELLSADGFTPLRVRPPGSGMTVGLYPSVGLGIKF